MTHLNKVNRIIFLIPIVFFFSIMVFQTSFLSSGRIEATASPYNEDNIIDITRHGKHELGIVDSLKSDYYSAANLQIENDLMNSIKEKKDEKNKATYKVNNSNYLEDTIIHFNSNDNSNTLEIVERDPARWSANVATNQTFTITYDKPIELRDSGEIYFREFGVYGSEHYIHCEVKTKDNELHVTPMIDLEPYTKHMINIGLLSITDLDGNTPESNETWSFHTGRGSNIVGKAPELVERDPNRWATNVSTAQTFKIIYDKPIELRDSEKIYFREFGVYGSEYYIHCEIKTKDNELHVTPMIDLEPYTKYMINTDLLSITDLDGNTPESDEFWSFHTGRGNNIIGTAPELVERDPARWTTNVAINQTFKIIYDKPIELRDSGEIYFREFGVYGSEHYIHCEIKTKDNELHVTPMIDLEPYTQYMINIGLLGLTDLDGNTPESDEFWSFHTGTEFAKVNLSALTVNPGALKPSFASETTEYTVDVSHDISSIEINATLSNESNALLTINGDPAESEENVTVELKPAGSETFVEIIVSANEFSKAYQVTVYRSESSEPSKLGDVNFDGVIDILDVTYIIQNVLELESFNVDQKAVADVNQDSEIDILDAVLVMQYIVRLISSFTESYPGIEPGPEDVALNASFAKGEVGETVTVEISANHARGTTGGQLALTFNPDIVKPVGFNKGEFLKEANNHQFAYNPEFNDNQLKLLWITPGGDTDDSGVVCTVDFKLLSQGESDIVFSDAVISPATFSIDTYNSGKITVDAIDDKVKLENLTISEGKLEPSFKPGAHKYTAEVGHDINTIDITATLLDENLTLKIDGEPAASGESSTVDLSSPGTTKTIEITVTSEDKTKETIYTILVNRSSEQPPEDYSPSYIYYENPEGRLVRADYNKAIEDLLEGDSRLRDAMRKALKDAIGSFKSIYVEAKSGIFVDYGNAVDAGKTYPECVDNLPKYGVGSKEPDRELIINPSTGEAEEIEILE